MLSWRGRSNGFYFLAAWLQVHIVVQGALVGSDDLIWNRFFALAEHFCNLRG